MYDVTKLIARATKEKHLDAEGTGKLVEAIGRLPEGATEAKDIIREAAKLAHEYAHQMSEMIAVASLVAKDGLKAPADAEEAQEFKDFLGSIQALSGMALPMTMAVCQFHGAIDETEGGIPGEPKDQAEPTTTTKVEVDSLPDLMAPPVGLVN